ncbi:uncharacterized protein LOC144715584 [Wolffia australiana]
MGNRGGEEVQRKIREPMRRLSVEVEEEGSFSINQGEVFRNSSSSSPHEEKKGQASIGLSEHHHSRILQSIGQSVHVSDVDGRIIYWNRAAEHLYGFSATEALGQKVIESLIDPSHLNLAIDMETRALQGGIWSGILAVKNKRGEKFIAVATSTPLYDDVSGKPIGITCVSSDFQSFKESSFTLGDSKLGAGAVLNLGTGWKKKSWSRAKATGTSLGRDSIAVNVSSDVVYLENRDEGASSGSSTPRGDVAPDIAEKSPRKGAKYYVEDVEGKMGSHKNNTAKSELWMAKEHDADESRNLFGWPWSNREPENNSSVMKTAEASVKREIQAVESNHLGNNEATGSSSSSVSSSGSTSSCTVQKLELESDCLDYEIVWEDLVIGEQIGQGSCGSVYHALWYGSDVAVKVFSKMEYSEEVINSFKQEVSLMKRLRHPNILLFMGSVTSPQRLCIVTEFLPRGSLFLLLQRTSTKLDWRRRVNMALDIARGVNYLHHCNPPVCHRDLKSSNLLVDKNWTVKVGDFGLSRLKRETSSTTNAGKGTPQWMAPEVLRNESADEKSDVYSYGVVLWELVTEKIPWDNLNSMQVIGAVGFMDQRLELPEDLDPQWASIISNCWHSEPGLRPTFQELIDRLKDLHRHYSLLSQMQRSSLGGRRKPPSD